MPDEIQNSQLSGEIAAGDSTARISQEVVETGAGDSNARISQETLETGAADSNARISQLTIELGRGPEVVPPAADETSTFTFDEGLGNEYFIVLQLSDYGDELRDHLVKAFRVTGKVTNAKVKIYKYGPLENVEMSDLETGTNSATGAIILSDTTAVQQSRRFPVNVKNAKGSTIRIEGNWPGTGDRDRVDEVVIEAARQGVRR